MSCPFFSVVIPVYNRAWCVERAVTSALGFARGVSPVEIVLVDDGSKDNSVEVIEALIERYGESDRIIFRLVRHGTNKGVCAAKNSGARASTGRWLVFLDSDDELIEDRSALVAEALSLSETCPLHFFRCIDELSQVPELLDLPEPRGFAAYFELGTDGEALPIVDRQAFLAHPYDEDLRGFESLAYLRMVREFGSAVIHSLVARRYYTSHEERLSSRRGLARRYRDLAIGNRRLLREHGAILRGRAYYKQHLRLLKYQVLSRIPFFAG